MVETCARIVVRGEAAEVAYSIRVRRLFTQTFRSRARRLLLPALLSFHGLPLLAAPGR